VLQWLSIILAVILTVAWAATCLAMGRRGWSLFFGGILAATFILWIVAPFAGWWLPPNVSTFGPDVDFLFYVILGFTGFFFILSEAILVWVMYRYAWEPERKSDYTHGNHRLEIAWTVVPAAILLFIAFAQVQAWEKIKYQSRMPAPEHVLQVTGRQWEWRLRYPEEMTAERLAGAAEKEKARRAWAEVPQIDDIHVPNELHTWKGARVKFYLKTLDVLHSFYLPNLRLKQDALPGKTIPVWFQATEANTRFDRKTGKCTEGNASQIWEIACAELCGGRHYGMRGRLFVHPDKEDYLAWLRYTQGRQQSRSLQTAAAAP
jgi:cytochrome c oxidase subunit 2